MSFDDFDDDNENNVRSNMLAAGALALLLGVNKLILDNKEGHCSLCSKPFKNKNLHKITMEELAKKCGDREVPDEIVKEYADKKVCNMCHMVFSLTIKGKLKELDTKKQQIEKRKLEELEKLKVVCSGCNSKFLEEEILDWSSIGLPKYWTIKSNERLCRTCRIKDEKQKYEEAKRKINIGMWHPINHIGAWKLKLDDISSKKNVSSDYYRDIDDAREELLIRAYREGFDVVVNGKYEKKVECEDNHKYSVWKAIGDFAKWKK